MENLTLTIAGASGVIGRHILQQALNRNWRVRILSRRFHIADDDISKRKTTHYVWNPEERFELDANSDVVKALEGSDFLINLAGASLLRGRLGTKMQQQVLKSRLDSTNRLIEAYKRCQRPPRVWAQASAVGFYGDTKEATVTEENPRGDLFLSRVCEQWENTAKKITDINPQIRLLIARFGMVLADDATAWAKMAAPIRRGFGGCIGSGRQWYSWIDADDAATALLHLYQQKDASGVYNFTSPQPVRQKELAGSIARFYHKPAFFWVPAFVIRLLMGKTGDELLLTSCKVTPGKLLKSGFQFNYPGINEEIAHIGKT